ncbi:tigger transposable element-derived protein 4-like [Euwallacea fornicatus]|uniref:tigger transposable element-derived protein 4-like n=1 Tax=Euwallacea fornicatus TaxID=995702 RepID=UPI00338EA98C
MITLSITKMETKLKKQKKSNQGEVVKCLLLWFNQKRHENVTITGHVLQEKANKMGQQIKTSNFSCSKRWIERFKKRHGTTVGKIVGESAAVNMNIASAWLTDVWPNIQPGHESDDIFNVDETGLFFILTPDKTLRFMGESCSG